MSVAARIKEAGSVVLGLALLIGMMTIGVAFLTGTAVLSVWILKWTFPAFAIALVLSFTLLVPLSLIPPSRGFSAVGFMTVSFAFGAILWVWAMAYTYMVWGLFAVILGMMLFGVGVLPVAMFAALVHGDWGNLGLFAVSGVFTVGSRVLANWLAEKADERAARLSQPEITAHAYEVPE